MVPSDEGDLVLSERRVILRLRAESRQSQPRAQRLLVLGTGAASTTDPVAGWLTSVSGIVASHHGPMLSADPAGRPAGNDADWTGRWRTA
jgi:hypothetical protein